MSAYRVARMLCRTLLRTFFQFRVEGREHEPAGGPLIVIANHTSALDPIIVGCALRRQVHFMAKEELFKIPGMPWLMKILGSFAVRRGQPDRQAFRQAMEVIHRGGVLGMFPEGTRSPDGRLQPAEPGAALLALRTGAPLLPVAITGAAEAMPKGSRRMRRAPITVRIGPPLRLPAAADGRPTRPQIQAAGDALMAGLARLLGQDPPVRSPQAREEGGGR